MFLAWVVPAGFVPARVVVDDRLSQTRCQVLTFFREDGVVMDGSAKRAEHTGDAQAMGCHAAAVLGVEASCPEPGHRPVEFDAGVLGLVAAKLPPLERLLQASVVDLDEPAIMPP